MKYAKYLCLCLVIVLPLIMLAQSDKATDRTTAKANYDGSRDDLQGCILAIDGNKVNFEEQWMYLSPEGTVVSSKNSDINTFNNLRAPFYAEIDIKWRGDNTYITSIRMLKQFEYGSDGIIIGEYNETAE